MLGAIIGDTVGSVYEFNNIKTKDFPLFSKESQLTDDSIMTLAVCEMIQEGIVNSKEKVIDTFKRWGRAYPNAGYGGYFYKWLFSNDRKSYNSFGNGAAMRVSACGWYGRDEEEVKRLAYLVTSPTHSHPEGIKGAEVTAMCIYYARIGKSKEFIKKYVEQYYSLDFDYEELRRSYYHEEEICQVTVPQAIYCFLISKDFEDCLRTTISIGGDCDTTAAISCAIAEAYYGYIDENIIVEIQKRLPKIVNDCNPMKILLTFMEDKRGINSNNGIINDDTKFLFINEKTKYNLYVECIYGKNLCALSEIIVFDKIFDDVAPLDDQFYDTFIEHHDLQGFIMYCKECSFSSSDYCNKLDELELILKDLLKEGDVNEYKIILERLNSKLKEMGSILSFNLESTHKNAIIYLEESNLIKDNYDNIFDRKYFINNY